jgi:hypothetical protein
MARRIDRSLTNDAMSESRLLKRGQFRHAGRRQTEHVTKHEGNVVGQPAADERYHHGTTLGVADVDSDTAVAGFA